MTDDRRKELGIDSLPGGLEAAIDELEAGEIGLKTLGEHVYTEYVAAKKAEWDNYRTKIHAWEIENYQFKF
jgi:glutamine synthetase